MLSSCDGRPELWVGLEEALMPLIARTLQSDAMDFFEDSVRMVELLAKNVPTFSTNMWSVLQRLAQALGEFAFDYLENMLPAMCQYMARGSDVICSVGGPVDYQTMFFNMATHIFGKEDCAFYDTAQATLLACALIQHSRGKMDQHIPRCVVCIRYYHIRKVCAIYR